MSKKRNIAWIFRSFFALLEIFRRNFTRRRLTSASSADPVERGDKRREAGEQRDSAGSCSASLPLRTALTYRSKFSTLLPKK